MGDRENSPTRIVEERLRLGAGFGAEDRGHVPETLSPPNRHLAHWSPGLVDLEISVQNRGGPEQKVILEAWLPRGPSLVATSAGREPGHALIEVRRDMIRQIEEDEKARRELHKAGEPRRGPA
jgi:hypothetical protein